MKLFAMLAAATIAFAAAPTDAQAPPAKTPPASAQTAVIPLLDKEIPGQMIGWTFNEIKPVFTAASNDGKPVIVLFTEMQNINDANFGTYANKMIAHVLRCPTFNALAGRAHFLLIEPSLNEENGALARHLQIDSYPAISVLRASGTSVNPGTTFSGFQDEVTLLENLKKEENIVPGSMLAARTSRLGDLEPEACGPRHKADVLLPMATLSLSGPATTKFH